MSRSLKKTLVHAQRRGREEWSKRINIDLDRTPTLTHGGRQFTFFNGLYDTYCCIPLVAAISFAGEPEPAHRGERAASGNAPDKRGAISLMSRLLPVLR